MEKIWSINNKEFTNREEAKEFLATAWKENPVKYLDGYDIDMMNNFEEYLAGNNKTDLYNWLLELSVCKNKPQVDKKLKELHQFVSAYIDKVVEEDVDDWLVEED